MNLARHLAAALACAGLLCLSSPGCQKGSDDKKQATGTDAGSDKSGKKRPSATRSRKEKIPPPPDVAAPPADAKKTEKGVAYKILTPKPGAQKPGPNDTVVVHYTGWTTDGNSFDSSVARKHPARFPLGRRHAAGRRG